MVKLIMLAITMLLIASEQTNADSKVNVKINNDVSGSSNSSVETNTNIRIETDGNVTTYSSDKPEK